MSLLGLPLLESAVPGDVEGLRSGRSLVQLRRCRPGRSGRCGREAVDRSGVAGIGNRVRRSRPAGPRRVGDAPGQPGGLLHDLGASDGVDRQHQLPLRRGDGRWRRRWPDLDCARKAHAACFDGGSTSSEGRDPTSTSSTTPPPKHGRTAPRAHGGGNGIGGRARCKVFYIGGDNDFFPGSGVFERGVHGQPDRGQLESRGP